MAGTDELRKKDNWYQDLRDEFMYSMHKPFEWGSHDCVHFVLRCIKAQTGRDFRNLLRPYKTSRGAYGMIKRFGGTTLIECFDLWAEQHGIKKVTSLKAKRGDIVCYVNEKKEQCMGIVALCGTKAFFLSKKDGLHLIPLEKCICGWGIE